MNVTVRLRPSLEAGGANLPPPPSTLQTLGTESCGGDSNGPRARGRRGWCPGPPSLQGRCPAASPGLRPSQALVAPQAEAALEGEHRAELGRLCSEEAHHAQVRRPVPKGSLALPCPRERLPSCSPPHGPGRHSPSGASTGGRPPPGGDRGGAGAGEAQGSAASAAGAGVRAGGELGRGRPAHGPAL